jgi:hypothetical protein
LAVKAGESFERNIAYIMANAGLYIDPDQPHQVKLDGKVVGDLDILAADPKSDTRIGVTCKNWETNPESKDFNHFMSMLELENLTHGVIAWIHLPSSIYPLRENAAKKGYRLAIIDRTKYEELHHWMLTGQRDNIESFFRAELNLQRTKTPTLGQTLELRRKPTSKRTFDFANLLPLNYGVDPPKYMRNAYFEPTEAKLLIRPYLIADFYLQKEAKIPRTGEVQKSYHQQIPLVADAITGRYLDQNQANPVANVVIAHYTDAVSHHKLQEDGFTVEALEPKVNKQEMVYKMRVDLARNTPPLELDWTEYRGEEEIERSKTIEVTPSDIREMRSFIVNVPVWHIRYQLGSYTYIREFLATDGAPLRDDMAQCTICQNPTVALCKSCGLVACDDHINVCKTCGELFCGSDSVQCVSCRSLFCRQHSVGQPCLTCGKFVCSADDVRCVTCQKTICEEHTVRCVQCAKTVCEEHQVESRYVGVKKKFCSETCHIKYDEEYKQVGVFGKLGKVARRK